MEESLLFRTRFEFSNSLKQEEGHEAWKGLEETPLCLFWLQMELRLPGTSNDAN